MTTLHTVNKSPLERNSLASCLRFARPGSALLLIEDGVYAGITGCAAADLLAKAHPQVKLYALEPDLKARGFDSTRVLEGIELIDYDGFVELSVTHDTVQAWL